MPKLLLKTPKQREQANALSATNNKEQKKVAPMDKVKLDRLLRQPRSKAYMYALHQLDAGGHVHNQSKVDAIINAIVNEFPEVELAGVMIGYVSLCYLGKPYEVHTLDMNGGIIEHFKAGQPLPGGMEKARSIAMRGGYAFIEVYTDCCRAISNNGSVSVIDY